MGHIDQIFIDAAQEAQRQYKVPASLTLAQFAIESAWGQKNMGANNYFGIKYGSLVQCNGYVEVPTREYDRQKGWYTIQAKFAKFDSIQDCFNEHARFIAQHPEWQEAMKHTDDPIAMITIIQTSHQVYATDPNYIKNVTIIINHNNLTQYDKLEPTEDKDAEVQS